MRERDGPFEQLSDEELMLRVREGDEGCFEILVGRYQRSLYSFIYRMVGQRETAEDLFQEAFLRVYRSAPRYTPRAKFRTFLYTVAQRLCLNELKKQSYRNHLPLDRPPGEDDGSARPREAVCDDPGPPEQIEACQRRDLVQEALQSLDEKHRTVILLAEVEELPYQQIARIIGSTVGTVKSRVHRGKLKIREWLERHELFQGP